MTERYYTLYMKILDGETVEDRVRKYHHRHRHGPHASLETRIEGASYFDDDVMVSIVTVVE